jgi:hypothetical protein
MAKLGEKQVKSLKSEAKAVKAQSHERAAGHVHQTELDYYVAAGLLQGSEVLLSGLTANEIVEMTQALTGQNIMAGLKDMKNKKGIVKRAQVALKDHGFEVLV